METVAAALAEFMAAGMSAHDPKTGLFERVALIGIGLIGSSLARVLRRDEPADRDCRLRPPRRNLGEVRRLDLADERPTIPPQRSRAPISW